jgi:outer membrane protein assembly factor BamA
MRENRTSETLRVVTLVLLSSLCVATATAQSGSAEIADEALDLTEELDDATTGRNGSFVAVPIPFSNPAVGTGLAIVGAYMYRLDPQDTETPSSFTGAGGFYADSESWGFGVAQKFFFNEDRMRLLVSALTTEINYDFYGIGNEAGESGRSIPLTQEADGASATFEYRVAGDVFVGFRLAVADLVTRVKVGSVLPPELDEFELAQDNRIEEVGFIARFDHRDHVYSPSDGHFANLNISSRKVTGGLLGDRSYMKYLIDFNRYMPLDNAVLAYRFSACYTGDDSPFYDVCSFGANSDLRGYTTGRYRDRSKVAAQIEYRRPISDRWAWAAFTGVGTVAPAFSDMSSDNLLPAVGAGVRFTVSKEQRISLRVDIARGADESTLHISVGEAF